MDNCYAVQLKEPILFPIYSESEDEDYIDEYFNLNNHEVPNEFSTEIHPRFIEIYKRSTNHNRDLQIICDDYSMIYYNNYNLNVKSFVNNSKNIISVYGHIYDLLNMNDCPLRVNNILRSMIIPPHLLININSKNSKKLITILVYKAYCQHEYGDINGKISLIFTLFSLEILCNINNISISNPEYKPIFNYINSCVKYFLKEFKNLIQLCQCKKNIDRILLCIFILFHLVPYNSDLEKLDLHDYLHSFLEATS